MEVFETTQWLWQGVLSGIISGVIASAIYTWISSRVNLKYRDEIMNKASTLNYMCGVLSHNIDFKFYDLAVANAEKCIDIIDCLYEKCNIINIHKVKKLWVLSLLSAMKIDLTTFLNISVGYAGNKEKEERLRAYKMKYSRPLYYKNEEPSDADKLSFMSALTYHIIKQKDIGWAFRYTFWHEYINCDSQDGIIEGQQGVIPDAEIIIKSMIRYESVIDKDIDLPYLLNKHTFNPKSYAKYTNKAYKQYLKCCKKDMKFKK